MQSYFTFALALLRFVTEALLLYNNVISLHLAVLLSLLNILVRFGSRLRHSHRLGSSLSQDYPSLTRLLRAHFEQDGCPGWATNDNG